jgi:hypothetical protein
MLCLDAAIALSHCGFHEEAFDVLRPTFAEAESYGAKGLALGSLYEASARVALEARDMARFESYLESCANEYAISRNPNLGTRVAAIIEEARDRGLYPSEAALPLPPSIQPAPINTEADTIHSRIVECLDASDRARCALTLLLQSTSSSAGFLYGTGSDRTLKLLAALPDAPTDPGLAAWVERCARSWVEVRNLDEVTVSASDNLDETLSAEVGTLDEISIHYVDADARPYTAIPLYDLRGTGRCLAAVFVLEVPIAEIVRLSKLLTTTIARELIEHEDAGGWLEES